MAPRRRTLTLPAIGLLGACAAPEERADALREAFESSRASLAAVAIGPASAAPPIVPALARPLPVATDPAAPRPAAAVELLGLGPDLLRRWLGEPAFRRREGSAEIWLYAGPACALDVILYPQAGHLHVAHAAARASGTEARTEAHCLGELAGLSRATGRGA
ncbi:hypothetical protein SAMN02927895_04768 [Belnapia rosea]|nr:hypothetical protein SAMN02927895_04768 [Belnapia rosea]